MKVAVVTGANGFIGRHLLKMLSADYDNVYCLTTHPIELAEYLKNLDNTVPPCNWYVYHYDIAIRNPESVEGFVDSKPVCFYHLAWSGSTNFRGSFEVQNNNVSMTRDCVRLAAQLNCKTFLFVSSIAVEEVKATSLTSYWHRLPLNAIYGASKLYAELIGKALANNLGMRFITAYITNAYGYGDNEGRLINSTLRRMMNGLHCEFSHGTQLYDFIHVDDAAWMIAKIGINTSVLGNSDNITIGSGSPRTLRDYIENLAYCTETESKLSFDKANTWAEVDRAFFYNVISHSYLKPRSFIDGIHQTMKEYGYRRTTWERFQRKLHNSKAYTKFMLFCQKMFGGLS